MKVQARSIDSIRPYPGNPRLNDDAVDAVAESIRRFFGSSFPEPPPQPSRIAFG